MFSTHIICMSDKRKYLKNPYVGKKRKAWNKLKKNFYKQ